MKFLTTPEANRLGVPTKVQASGVFLLMGIIIMYWSFALNFAFGNAPRLIALFMGALFVGVAVLLRAGPRLSEYAMPLLGGVTYFSLLLLISKIQGHDQVNPTLLPYTTVAFILLLCGYVLGCERPFFNMTSSRWMFVLFALACALNYLLIIRTLQTGDTLARGTVYRSSFNEFNPISIAFNTGCVASIFLALTFVNRQFIKRLIYFGAFSVMILLVLASASRGPVLWITLTFIIVLIMVRRHRYFNAKHRLYFLGIFLIGLVLAVIAYSVFGAVSTRVDILVRRFTSLFMALTENTHMLNKSSSGRLNKWGDVLYTYRDWLLMGQKHYGHYPHNFWLEMLVRFGLLGIPLLLLSIYVMARLMLDVIRARIPADGEFTVIATLFIFAYLCGLTSLTFTSNRALFLGLGYFLGYYVTLRKRRKSMPPQGVVPERHL